MILILKLETEQGHRLARIEQTNRLFADGYMQDLAQQSFHLHRVEGQLQLEIL
jgi:hypothetical protein